MSSVLPSWRDVSLPEAVTATHTMLYYEEQQMLFALARDHFKNEGSIVDAGCFLGGSTVALAAGLLENPRFKANPREQVIHSYDLFEVEPWAIGHHLPADTALDRNLLHDWAINVTPFADVLAVHPGDIREQPAPDNIEILFIDVAKNVDVNEHMAQAYFPHLIPGHSIVIQQDYLYEEWNGWIHILMEWYSDYFEMVGSTERNSVAFLYKKRIPREFYKPVVPSLPADARLSLYQRAIDRFQGEQRTVMERARDHFDAVQRSPRWRYGG